MSCVSDVVVVVVAEGDDWAPHRSDAECVAAREAVAPGCFAPLPGWTVHEGSLSGRSGVCSHITRLCRQREDDRDKSHLMCSLSESAECVNVSELKQIEIKKHTHSHTRVILFKFHTKTTTLQVCTVNTYII